MRIHARMKAQAEEVQFAPNTATSKEFATKYGIKGTSIFNNLSSIVFPYSFPFDFMHLSFENNVKNLISLWTGNFKGLDTGNGDYELEADEWEAIGRATAAAGSYIPSAFAARPPDLADDKQSMTADAYLFWIQYIAPVLLHKKLPSPHYNHFIEYVKLNKLCLEFELQSTQVQEIHNGFVEWVENYEK
ncbi:hypothetical protein V5O48_012398 [Marasmius crinis-equi]|uniref:Uncharacterized protein n=1 Tax=Marasmius crinis-equi TaxID=585013 RepID=A0ABR3F3I2_9AGAR